MYAIVDIAGQQFKVEQGQEVFVHRLQGEEGAQIMFDDVLLIDSDGTVSVGKPNVEGAFVSAKILSHLKGDKVLVFKKKRRKGYQKLNGHRDLLTRILIENISLTGGKIREPEVKKIEVKEEVTQVSPLVETITESPVIAQEVTEEVKPKPRRKAVKKEPEEGAVE
jgi:large subunit ribosomal protein L21